MYYYFFDRYFWHDRVARCDMLDSEPGDFFEMVGYGYVVCLWSDISRVEQYTKYIIDAPWEIILLARWLLSRTALVHLHDFTRRWFCTYKKAIWLRIKDPEEFAKRMPTGRKKKMKKKKTKSEKKIVWNTHDPQEAHLEYRDGKNDIHSYLMNSFSLFPTHQKLLVFPDLWMMRQTISDKLLTHASVLFLHARMTKKQQAEAFWEIKMGKKICIFSTPSQVFHDRDYLSEIVLFDQHKWYYKQPQDPRYNTREVCTHLSTIVECPLVSSWFSLH